MPHAKGVLGGARRLYLYLFEHCSKGRTYHNCRLSDEKCLINSMDLLEKLPETYILRRQLKGQYRTILQIHFNC